MNAPFVIQNVSAAQVTALATELQSDPKTMVIPKGPNLWEINGHGVVAEVQYGPVSQALSVTVLSKPFIYPLSMIHDQIVKALGH